MIMHEKPDCPMDHKCEKCDNVADSVTCMYHVPSKSVKYRYLCHQCLAGVILYQIYMGFEPVDGGTQ